MSKNKLPVRFTGQHFTIDKVLIADAIKLANIKDSDTVLDIGAGKGFLTVHLVRYSSKVIAIEKDKSLVNHLRKKFQQQSNIKILANDFRSYSIPKKYFKVVSNIPYGITSDILKSLMFENVENFMGGCIIMQLEAAKKLTTGKFYNPYTVFYQTFFDLELVYEVSPFSFMPPPKIKSALLKIHKKKNKIIDLGLKQKYFDFLHFMLRIPDTQILTVLKKLFRKRQAREISKKYGFDLNDRVVNLTVDQYVNCFNEMLDKVPEKLHPDH